MKALSFADEGRGSGTYKPAWTKLSGQLKKFTDELPDTFDGLKHATYTDDTIGQFATLSSRSKGSDDPFFYSTLLMFLIHEASTGGLDGDYMRMLSSRSDRLYPRRVVNLIADRLDGLPATPEESMREIRQTFLVKESLHRKFDEYVQKRSIDCGRSTSKQLSLVLYRPTRREPSRFIKTYVSIYEQSSEYVESSGFDYTHIYRPPESGRQDRFSRGKIIPLDDALYLVGGQRPLEDHNRPRPFSSIKAISIKWIDIERNHEVFPILAMTTNYDGKLLVSRAAARLSPVGHSKDLTLRTIEFDNLHTSLLEDQTKEVKFIQDIEDVSDDEKKAIGELFPLTRSGADPKVLAKQISTLSNNDPHTDHGWAVPPGFGIGTSAVLDADTLRYKISEALGVSKGKPYKDQDGASFNLWNDTRFGPLSID